MVDDVEVEVDDVELLLVDEAELGVLDEVVLVLEGWHPAETKQACKSARTAGSVAAAIKLESSWHCAGDSVVDVVDGVMVELVEVVLERGGRGRRRRRGGGAGGGVQAALYWTWSVASVAGSVVLLMRAWMVLQRGLWAPADVSPESPATPAMPAQTSAQALLKLLNRPEIVSTPTPSVTGATVPGSLCPGACHGWVPGR